MCAHSLSCSVVFDSCSRMDCSPPGYSVMRFSRQKYWSGVLFPYPGDPPDPGSEPASPALAGEFFTAEPQEWNSCGKFCLSPLLPLPFPLLLPPPFLPLLGPLRSLTHLYGGPAMGQAQYPMPGYILDAKQSHCPQSSRMRRADR